MPNERFRPSAAQQDFLDYGARFLNESMPRGSGKSYVMAYVALQQAISGRRVYLYDPSVLFSHGANYQVHRHFADLVIRMSRVYFSEYDFEYSNLDNVLRCTGYRQPPIPLTPPPLPPEPEVDDDGSLENAD